MSACVCERGRDSMYVCVSVKGALTVVSSPPCSICHSFGAEDKHTDQNDSDHKTISVWICLLLFASRLFLLLSSPLSFFLSCWGVRVENGHLHAIVYAHICCILNICLLGTWTTFQTPASSPQFNFTLFKHTLSEDCCS